MGYVRFKSNPEVFQMHVKVIGDNMVQLYPPIPNVDVTAGFEMLTKEVNGKVYGDYLKYRTVYKKEEDGSVIL